MSLLDTLLGRTREVRSRDDQLIALSTAAVTLQADLGLVPSGQAGIVVRPIESEAYRQAGAGLAGLLEIAGRETGATISERTDGYGYRWVAIADDSLADLVSTAYEVSIELRDAGFGDQVLAAAFGFRDADGRPVFWLYSFKRGAFYPFAPAPDGRTHDSAQELRLAAAIGRELPVEPDQTRWYPMWGMPLDGAPSDAPGHGTAGTAGQASDAQSHGSDTDARGDSAHDHTGNNEHHPNRDSQGHGCSSDDSRREHRC